MKSITDIEKIATEFVKNKKNPSEITISSGEPKNEGWIVKGSYPVKIEHGSGSEKFTVEINKDGEIASYNFEPGFFFAVM